MNGRPVIFRVAVEGQRQALDPILQDEVYRIARELLRNAFRHGHASQIEADIRYEQPPASGCGFAMTEKASSRKC